MPQQTVATMKKAITAHIMEVQQLYLKDELAALHSGQQLSSKSALNGMSPFLDGEGIIRVRGRYPDGEYTPAYLPCNTKLNKLIILAVHGQFHHTGPSWTLFQYRHNYYCARSMKTISDVLKSCVYCKRMRGKFASQQMASLPNYRTERNPRPFSYVGVDFAGPFMLYDSKKDEASKAWFVIFTCQQIRAIHLELLTNMTTATFMQCFRRFVARFGAPIEVRSDCGRTFTRAGKEFAALYDGLSAKEVQQRVKDNGIVWKFNAPGAPWWGALYERLIRSIKDVLKAAIQRKRMDRDEFHTVLCEAEGVVNCRPLADISEEPSDPLPVSPAMLLLGYNPAARQMPAAPVNLDNENMNKIWNGRLRTRAQCQVRFIKDYIQGLMERQKWLKESPPLKVGQVVLYQDPTRKRIEWPLARIKRLIIGRDGLIRSVELITKDGVNNTIIRAVQRLVPLEVPGEVDAVKEDDFKADDDSDGEPSAATLQGEEVALVREGMMDLEGSWKVSLGC